MAFWQKIWSWIETIFIRDKGMYNRPITTQPMPKTPPQPLQPIWILSTTPAPDTPVIALTAPKTALLWDTPVNVRHSCRIVMDEFGLSKKEKDLLCAIIEAESRFNNKAICRNKNSIGKIVSTDWGILQINDYYHIGADKTFPSVDYVLNNPDACVRFMVKMFRAGKLKLWVAFLNGSYKKYLK